jgi:iron(III) transport system permease protein
MTLDNYRAVFSGRGLGDMVWNTAIATAVSSFLTMVLATFIAWLTVRRPGPLTRTLNALTFLPLAIPAPVAALGILVLYIRTPLYATLWIMVVAFVGRGLPFATRLMHSAQLQIDKALDEAAYVSGASPLRTFFYINIKLLMPSFINGYTWVFAHVVRDFTIPLFLATASTAVIANLIFLRYENGDTAVAATYMILLFVVVVVLALITRFSLRSPGERRGAAAGENESNDRRAREEMQHVA